MRPPAAAAMMLVLFFSAGAVQAGLADVSRPHVTVGLYLAGTLTCYDIPFVCTDQFSPLLGCGVSPPILPTPNGPAEFWPNGACGLSLPSIPWYRITVTDELGQVVRFAWGVYYADGSGSCPGADAYGTIVTRVPPECLDGRELYVYVIPWLGSVAGKVVLTPS